jgi:hypothetical protein
MKYEVSVNKVYLIAFGGLALMLVALIAFLYTCKVKGNKIREVPKSGLNVTLDKSDKYALNVSPNSTASEEDVVY